MKTQTFSKTHRLLRKIDFLLAAENGSRFFTKNFIFYFLIRESGQTRLGVTVSKKVGNAVYRNRIKRLLREVFRKSADMVTFSADILVIAKRNCEVSNFDNVFKEWKKALELCQRAMAKSL